LVIYDKLLFTTHGSSNWNEIDTTQNRNSISFTNKLLKQSIRANVSKYIQRQTFQQWKHLEKSSILAAVVIQIKALGNEKGWAAVELQDFIDHPRSGE